MLLQVTLHETCLEGAGAQAKETSRCSVPQLKTLRSTDANCTTALSG